MRKTHKTTKSQPQAHRLNAGHAKAIADAAPIVPTAILSVEADDRDGEDEL
ncbi:MAG: hypothetical protein Q9225_005100 [Loekoesia sp. 1 TL-2023]